MASTYINISSIIVGGGGSGNHSGLTLDDGSNPHGTTKADVGLANANNTSDADKPVSTATQTALNLKAQSGDNVSIFVNDAAYITSAGVPVDSVFGRTGIVAAVSGDYDADEITETLTRVFVTPAEKLEIAANTLKVSADGSIDTHSDVDITSILNDDFLIWDGLEFIPFAKDLLLTKDEIEEEYVLFGTGITATSTGIKGQWSWNPIEETYLACIATNTWVNLYTLELINKRGFIREDDAIDDFVLPSLVTGPNSPGIKGQWSYSLLFLFKCIATNTWVRYAVEASF